MSDAIVTFEGVIHGKTIELSGEPGFSDGQHVRVHLQPVTPRTAKFDLEAHRRAFGAWSDAAKDLDAYVAWTREQRRQGRRAVES
jgi:hypothetical protein